jgi:hypothetical protein
LAKSRNSIKIVIPAKAGIQLFKGVLDPGLRRGDASRDFLPNHQIRICFEIRDSGFEIKADLFP